MTGVFGGVRVRGAFPAGRGTGLSASIAGGAGYAAGGYFRCYPSRLGKGYVSGNRRGAGQSRFAASGLVLGLFLGLLYAPLAAQESSVVDELKGGARETPAPPDGGFDEAEFDKNYKGPNIGVIYDERSGAGYFVVENENEYKEYHYLEEIRYDDLLFMLTDTLSRLTKEGYRWASLPLLEVFNDKLPESEVAFIYEIDKRENAVNARVQFPDFKISLTARKARDARHRFDASSGRDMFQLINTFAYRINEVESVLGMNNIEYAMRYFKKDTPDAGDTPGDGAATDGGVPADGAAADDGGTGNGNQP